MMASGAMNLIWWFVGDFLFFLQRMRRMVAQLRSNSVPGRVEKKINN